MSRIHKIGEKAKEVLVSRYLAQLEPQVVVEAGGDLRVFLLRIAGSQHTEHRPLVGIAALPHGSPAKLERIEKI